MYNVYYSLTACCYTLCMIVLKSPFFQTPCFHHFPFMNIMRHFYLPATFLLSLSITPLTICFSHMTQHLYPSFQYPLFLSCQPIRLDFIPSIFSLSLPTAPPILGPFPTFPTCPDTPLPLRSNGYMLVFLKKLSEFNSLLKLS